MVGVANARGPRYQVLEHYGAVLAATVGCPNAWNCKFNTWDDVICKLQEVATSERMVKRKQQAPPAPEPAVATPVVSSVRERFGEVGALRWIWAAAA